MNDREIIHQHYEKVAKNFGLGIKSSMADKYIREAEFEFIIQEITKLLVEKANPLVLDIGRGNGCLLALLREKFPQLRLAGIELNRPLYELAISRNLLDVPVILGDCLDLDSIPAADMIITERVIINILHKKKQYQALKNIISRLEINGHYLMIESFNEPLRELNCARKEFLLDTICASTHNRYLNNSYLEFLQKKGMQQITTLMPSNYLSTHFFVSRILHAAIKPQGGKSRYTRLTHFFDQALPAAIGNYSPILFFHLKKIAQVSLD